MDEQTDRGFWDDAEVISTYTRAQALEDGFLVDVSEMAREAGTKFAVALTRAVWTNYVEVPEGVVAQDESGRLWDILWMLRCQIRRSRGDTLHFQLYVRNHTRERLTRQDLVMLKAICGPGDEGEPVITIMLPDED